VFFRHESCHMTYFKKTILNINYLWPFFFIFFGSSIRSAKIKGTFKIPQKYVWIKIIISAIHKKFTMLKFFTILYLLVLNLFFCIFFVSGIIAIWLSSNGESEKLECVFEHLFFLTLRTFLCKDLWYHFYLKAIKMFDGPSVMDHLKII
jgi:hypothetical protein